MKSEKKIKKVLSDLYKIDSKFKKHEKKILKIIKELLLLQPKITLNDKFVEDLRDTLKIEEEKVAKNKKNTRKRASKKKSKDYFLSFNFFLDLSRVFLIVSVFLLLFISFSFVGIQNKRVDILKNYNQSNYLEVLDDAKIVKRGKNNFGSLYSQSVAHQSMSSEFISDSPDFNEFDGAMMPGDAHDFEADVIANEGKTEDGFMGDDAYTAPAPVKYNYIYTGGDFDLFEPEVDVFKRADSSLPKDLANIFTDKNFISIDISRFNNIGVSNFSLMEDKDFGYNISFNLEDGNFSIYKNWKRWPRIENSCSDQGYDQCIEGYNLSFEEVLSNQEILRISNNFLREYKVDLSDYGPGEVENEWIREYYLSPDKDSHHIPSIVRVVYPLVIEEKTVYEEYGQKAGLSVEVDLREKKVAGLYGVFYQRYESSVYEAETSKDKIMQAVYRGDEGYYGYPEETFNDEYEVVDIELGAPSLALVKIWDYDESFMVGRELYIPAYVFPVISQSKDPYFYKKNVVISAVKEFFNKYNNFNGLRGLPALMDDEDLATPNDSSTPPKEKAGA